MTDKYVESTHVADSHVYNPSCTTDFDYYANTVIENGTKDFDLYINSFDELKNAVIYGRDNGILLEIKVDASIAKTESELFNKIKAYAGSRVKGIVMLYSATNYNTFAILFE